MWDFPLLPDQASTSAGSVDALMLFELAVLIFFTALVLALYFYWGIKYRRGSRVDRSGAPDHDYRIEAVMIGVPLAISLVMFAWSAIVFFDLYSPPPDAVEVNVIAKQWMWKLQHPEGKKEINELHVPVGQAVKLKMISDDVIHSFYVPAFRTKQDVLPGRYTELWFRPTKPGKYHLFCTEYCGTSHSAMGGFVYVMEPADYERWLRDGPNSSMAKEGERLFVANHCSGCHGPNQQVKAPRLEGVYGKDVPILGDDGEVRFVRADDRYIRDSILLPKSQVVAGYEPVMPSYAGRISEEDLLKIIEYIKSIGSATPPTLTVAEQQRQDQARMEAEESEAQAGGEVQR